MRPSPDLVWYASYGANMALECFSCYLVGVPRPAAAAPIPAAATRRRRAHGARCGCPAECTSRRPRRCGAAVSGCTTPGWRGRLRPAPTSSPRASSATSPPRRGTAAPARAPTRRACPSAAALRLGEGRYDILVHCGDVDGRPVLTFTAHWPSSAVEAAAPSAAYLSVIAAGLRDAHSWNARRSAAYSASRPGAVGAWRAEQVAALP